ncbi:MAG TPA: hypothetical protein VNV66_02790 [Pilimelia sp.]|nr:hypothetical protein [Pilimelia sp.]
MTIPAVREDICCEALFVSCLQRSEPVTPAQVHSLVSENVLRHGERGCAALVAQEFGEHPETAVHRMRWIREVVRDAYGDQEAA